MSIDKGDIISTPVREESANLNHLIVKTLNFLQFIKSKEKLTLITYAYSTISNYQKR
jgi:hypothetical protein